MLHQTSGNIMRNGYSPRVVRKSNKKRGRRRPSEPIHEVLRISAETLPSPSVGGGKSRKMEFSEQGENPAEEIFCFNEIFPDPPTRGGSYPGMWLAELVVDRPWTPTNGLDVESGFGLPWFCRNELNLSSSVTNMESVGSTLFKKPSWSTWEKGEFLGSGTFGTVYEGVSSDGMFFAVKEVSLSDQGKTGKQAIRQLEQEIALLSEIEHPNIVRYLGTERDDEKLYIFLELVSKGSLAHVYEKYFVRYGQVRAYTKQILSGLKYLHDRKIIHRDIKCANILVDTSGVVKLADFGMAKQVDNLGRLKSFLGSAHWMAPEVINPKMSYDFRADIWSLGCTVLEMAIGKPPFGELEAHGVLWKVGQGEGPPIPDELEEDLQSFISNCLVVNAAERPTCDMLMKHPFITGAPMNGPVKLISECDFCFCRQVERRPISEWDIAQILAGARLPEVRPKTF